MTRPVGEDVEVVERYHATVAAVLDLHRRVHDGYLDQDICAECSDHDARSWTLWPCATVRTVMEHIGGSADQ